MKEMSNQMDWLFDSLVNYSDVGYEPIATGAVVIVVAFQAFCIAWQVLQMAMSSMNVVHDDLTTMAMYSMMMLVFQSLQYCLLIDYSSID